MQVFGEFSGSGLGLTPDCGRRCIRYPRVWAVRSESLMWFAAS